MLMLLVMLLLLPMLLLFRLLIWLLLLLLLLQYGAAGPDFVVAAALAQKPHENRSSSRNPYRFGSNSPRRHYPFSCSSSVILLDPYAIKQ